MMNDIEICNAALTRLGVAPISSFDDGSTEADAAKTFYGMIRDALLATYPWGFADAHESLCLDGPVDSDPDHRDFDWRYLLPGRFIKAINTSPRQCYVIESGKLFSNSDTVSLNYIKRTDESEFPPHFVSALINRLAAEMCSPLTENASRSELLFRLAETEMKLAKLIDSQPDTVDRHDINLIPTP